MIADKSWASIWTSGKEKFSLFPADLIVREYGSGVQLSCDDPDESKITSAYFLVCENEQQSQLSWVWTERGILMVICSWIKLYQKISLLKDSCNYDTIFICLFMAM